MKKTILLLTLSLMSLQLLAQSSIPYPTLAQFEAFRVKELDASIKHAEYLSSSTINFSEFKLIKKSEIVGFRRDESSSIERWPNDGCAVRYFYENPKIVNGIQSKIEVVVEYKRSTCDASECVLEDKWSAYVVNVLPFYEDKGMTKTEADKLAELCIKSEFAKTNLLKDFIEIKAFSPYTYDEANPTYNFSKVTNAQTVEFRVNLTGTLGAFSSDKSIFLAETERSETIEFQLKYTNGTWNVVGSTSNYSSMFSSSDKSLLYKEIPTKRFGTYSEKGFDAIYMKRVEEALPTNNPLATLMTFSKEFSDFFSANSATLTNENLAKFFALNDEDKAESAKEALQKVIALPTLSETQGYTNFTLTSIKFRDFDEEIEDEKLRQKGRVSLTFTAKEVMKKGKKSVETGVTKEFYFSLDCIMTPEGWKIFWF
ncbi:MAG: hypothetical protein ACK479_13490 [Fluviicola sp.]